MFTMNSSRSENLKTIKDDIKALVVSNKSRMSVADLCQDYSTNIGKRLSGAEFGYKSVHEFLQRECTDILKIETIRGESVLCPILKTEAGKNLNSLILKQKSTKRPNACNRNTIITKTYKDTEKPFSKIDTTSDKQNDKSKSTPALMTSPKTDEKDKILSEVLKNLQFLIAKHKKLQGFELSAFYELQFKKPLDMDKLGFTDLLSLIENHPEVFTVQKLHESDEWVVYDQSVKHEKEFWTKYQENREKKENPRTSLNSLIFGLEALPYTDTDPELMPDDCVPFGHKINSVKPPYVDTEIQLNISEVLDPSHFWFHIRSPHHREALYSLMTEINTFYNSDKKIYKMTRAQMKPGQYCVVKFCRVYHRAVVLSNVAENIIKVRYIDYGTIEEVPTDDVRLLLKKFSRLERQALAGRLSSVRPVNHIWSRAARIMFLELTNSKPLSAHVTSVDEQDVSTLILVDKNQETFSVVSHVLYEEGMARFITTDKKHWRVIDHVHLLPSFKELDSGLYPMFVDFEKNTEKSFLLQNLLSSFCDLLTDKIPSETTDISSHLNGVSSKRSMNDTIINHFNPPNFHPPSYQSRVNDFEYAPNYPNYDPRSYDPRSYDPRSYDPYRRLSMRSSMETKYNPPGRSYKNPNVWPNYTPNQHLQFYEDEFERQSNFETWPRYNDRGFEFGRFDETNRESTLFLNDNLHNVGNNKTVMNIKNEKFSEYDEFETKIGSAGNNLTIVDTFCIAGQEIDIWKVKYMDKHVNYPFIVLEQLFYYFMKPNSRQNFWDKFNSGKIQLQLLQLQFHQSSVLGRIETHGRSSASIDECIQFQSMSNEIVYKFKDSLILLNLAHVLYFVKCHNQDLKVRYQDIMKDMLPILKKYMNNNEHFYT